MTIITSGLYDTEIIIAKILTVNILLTQQGGRYRSYLCLLQLCSGS